MAADWKSVVTSGAFLGCALSAVMLVIGCVLAQVFGKKLSSSNKLVLVWIAFDIMTHLFMDTPYFVLFYLHGPKFLEKSNNFYTRICKEYGNIDKRVLTADPGLMAILLFTCVACVPLEIILFNAIIKDKSYRHTVQTLVAGICIFGAWMYVVPELLVGSPNLSGDLVSLLVFFGLAVLYLVVPHLLLYQSIQEIPSGTRQVHTVTKTETQTVRRSQRIRKKAE
ncbi:emopamil-binding protein-like [Ptychodera flava]|uniref:emopamil-binding protein-like n=1 Tax=Ptychodera flava TaxID=63121 RepID=UPI003969D8FD